MRSFVMKMMGRIDVVDELEVFVVVTEFEAVALTFTVTPLPVEFVVVVLNA